MQRLSFHTRFIPEKKNSLYRELYVPSVLIYALLSGVTAEVWWTYAPMQKPIRLNFNKSELYCELRELAYWNRFV